ncbi:MAG TPA: glycosyltransferase family 4 protein [Acetobacteraceae bacterium]|nr:glycosyltransferase family 4 protein [Acetobacteraceae bacterium]
MHIALIAPAGGDGLSRGDVYDRRLAAALRAAGHRVDDVTLASDAFADLPSDVTLVIDGMVLPRVAPFAATLAARGAVGLIHHPTAIEPGRDEADRAALRSLFAMLRRLIATNAATAERLVAEFGVEPARIVVVPPGTDAAPRSEGSGGPACQILSVGALIPRKGHDVLLHALSHLPDLDWRLTVVGDDRRDPVHAATLRALAQEPDLAGRVTFVAAADDAALSSLWRAADLFALATRWEGYGVAVAEALRRGLPVAVTEGGAAAALVPAEAGAVCPVDDPDAQLSKALRRMIFDVRLRRQMADAAWKAGQRLPDWSAQAEAFARALA